MYGKCSKISNTFLSHLKCWLSRLEFIKHLSEEQTGEILIRLHLQKQSDLGLHCLSRHFWQTISVRNFRKFAVSQITSLQSQLSQISSTFNSLLFQTSLFCTKREHCQLYGAQSEKACFPDNTQTSLLSYRV